MAVSLQALAYADGALTELTSQPDPGEASLSMPWLRRVPVPATMSKGDVTIWRALITANSTGVNMRRAPGHAYATVDLPDPSTVAYETNERSLFNKLDYVTIARAQDPLDVQRITGAFLRRLVMLGRYKDVRDLLTTTANWGSDNNAAITAATFTALGGSGVALSNAASTPFVDFEVGAQLCADQNGQRRPDGLILSDKAISLIGAIGARTVLPVDLSPVREIRHRAVIDALSQHLGMEVHEENAAENNTRLWPATGVYYYNAGSVIAGANGAPIVPPMTCALIQEQIDQYLSGEMAVVLFENAQRSGLELGVITSDDPLAVDQEAIFLATGLY